MTRPRRWREFRNHNNTRCLWYELWDSRVSSGDALLQFYGDVWHVGIAIDGMEEQPQTFEDLEEAKAFAEVLCKLEAS